MDGECPRCRYRASRWEIDSAAGDPLRIAISCGRCHDQVELEGEAAAAWLDGSGFALPPIEWVVITRNGQRHELTAPWWETRWEAGSGWSHRFSTLPVVREWPGEQVTLVQRRNGHLLQQVWPVEADE